MSEIIIPMYCRKVGEALEKQNFEWFLVGGCVRDSILGKSPDDFDMATNASPDEMLKCFKNFKVVETGLKHGTLSVFYQNHCIEVTTYRVDGEYSDNRHPNQVEFTKDLKDDLKRRDFTVNAMAFNEKVGLVDLFGGINDLNKGLIRCVGEPDLRFSEDGLRILRALRFSSVLGFEIEEKTAKSIINNKDLLKGISKERIFSEFKKLICGKNAENVLLKFKEVFAVIFPEIVPCFEFNQNTKYHCYDVYTHIVKTVSAVEPTEKLRLACFFHDIGKPNVYFTDENSVGHFYGHNKESTKIAEDILKRYKADNEILKFVKTAVYYHDFDVVPTEKAVKRFLNKASKDFLLDLIKIKRADAYAHAEKYRDREEYFNNIINLLNKIEDEQQCFLLKDLDLNGNDLIENGYKSGKIIGDLLNTALSAVIDGKIKNEKEELLKYIKELD